MTQTEALDILKMGKSVFLTGAAGSGKTHVLREYIKWLDENDIAVGITASTGIAATHMGGMTIHAWAGIGIRQSMGDDEIEALVEKSYLKGRFNKAKVLIIDEISMLHHFRLDLVERMLRHAKKNKLPFGGIQVVFCGDFFQLPPVTRQGEEQSKFAYMSDSWAALNPTICYLHESHRQNDEKFLRILHAIRDNDVEDGIGEMLMERFGAKTAGDIEPTRLYTHNKDVDEENDRELELLPGEATEFYMESNGRESVVMTLKKSCLAPEALRLKLGAKVMFVKNNFDQGYANGTLGVIEMATAEKIVVRVMDGRMITVESAKWQVEDNGKLLGEISQYPLRLAWAITIHKSQGMSLDAAEIDLSKSFERGMGYVALSRVRTFEGLSIKGMNNMAMQIHEEALEKDKEFKNASDEAVSDLEALHAEKPDGVLAAQQVFKERSAASSLTNKPDTVTQTKDMLLEGKTILEIAAARELTQGTVIDHVEKIRAQDPNFNINHLRDAVPAMRFKKIYGAFQKVGTVEGGKRPLAPVMSILGKGFAFEELRLVRLFL